MTNAISININEIKRQIEAYKSIHNEYPYIIMSIRTYSAINDYLNENKITTNIDNDRILYDNKLPFGMFEVR